MRLPRQPGVKPIRVIVADATLMACGLVSAGLNRHSQFEVVGFAASTDELFRLVEHARPEVALISATLQDGPLSDLAVVSQIHGEYAETRLIVLIDRSEPDLVVQAFRAGATASRWSLEGADLVYRSGEMHVLVECKPFRQTVAKNLAAFRWGKRRVVSSPKVLGGEPVFRGTRIPLHHVASLFRKGVPEQVIVEDFPSLNARDLAHARLFSRSGEKPGRPRKRLVLQRNHEAV